MKTMKHYFAPFTPFAMLVAFIYAPLLIMGIFACSSSPDEMQFTASSATTSSTEHDGGYGGNADGGAAGSGGAPSTGGAAGAGNEGGAAGMNNAATSSSASSSSGNPPDPCDCTVRPIMSPCGTDNLGNCFHYNNITSCWYYCFNPTTMQDLGSFSVCPNPCGQINAEAYDPIP